MTTPRASRSSKCCELVNEQTRQPAANPVDRVLAEGVIVGLANHTLLVRKDGSEIPIDDSAAPIRNREGRLTGCVLVFRDIAQRKQAEARISQLLASEQLRADQLRKLADAALTLNSATTRESIVGVVRSEAKYVFDAARVDVQVGDLGGSDDERPRLPSISPPAAWSCPWSPATARRSVTCSSTTGERASSPRTMRRSWPSWLTWRRWPCKMPSSTKSSAPPAIAKTNSWPRCAHELRNPLAPIRYSLELMRLSDNDPDALAESRTIIERQVTQMVRLIDDLLDVSRISRGKIELRRDYVTLQSVIAAAREASQPIIADYQHQLASRRTHAANLGPRRRHAAGPGPAQPAQQRGQVHAARRPHQARRGAGRRSVVIRVRDNGIGIPADKLGQVFEMFSQVDRSLERSQSGLGIGLTLVRRLVEMHGGTAEAMSDGPGKGSEFIVRLPCVANPPADGAQPKAADDGVNDAQTCPLRILAVDDNQDAVDVLARTLQLKGHQVETAYDGLAAVDAAARFHPNVALLDLGLPRLSGYDAARRIRQLPGGEAITLVAITGWGQEDDRRQSQASGFDAHLVKPVDPTQLLKLLGELDRSNRRSTPAKEHAP